MSALAESTTQDLISIVAWAIERTGKSPATAREIAARSIAQHDRQVEAEVLRKAALMMECQDDCDTLRRLADELAGLRKDYRFTVEAVTFERGCEVRWWGPTVLHLTGTSKREVRETAERLLGAPYGGRVWAFRFTEISERG